MDNIKKLIVKEFEVKESSGSLSVGAKYSYFQDPSTQKYYRPKEVFEVTGVELETLFEEVIV